MITLAFLFAATQARAEPALMQHPGARVPYELSFRDESGRLSALGSLAGGKPTVLVLAYYSCPGLCAIVLNRLAETLLTLPLKLERDFRVLTVSIDPADTPAQAAEKRAERWRRVAHEASQQARRSDVPLIEEPRPLAERVRAASSATRRRATARAASMSEVTSTIWPMVGGSDRASSSSIARMASSGFPLP